MKVLFKLLNKYFLMETSCGSFLFFVNILELLWRSHPVTLTFLERCFGIVILYVED